MKKLLAKGFIILFILGIISLYVFIIINIGWTGFLISISIALIGALLFHLFELAVKNASSDE